MRRDGEQKVLEGGSDKRGRSLHVLRSQSSEADAARRSAMEELGDREGMRNLAGEIRSHTLEHLDLYLKRFEERVREWGGRVHLARDAAEARRTVVALARKAKVTSAAYRASAVGEEVRVAAALRRAGIEAGGAGGMAVVGATFVVAETGQVCVVEEENGEAGELLAGAQVVVCVAGIESVVPRLGDLAVMLKLLTRSSSGRAMGVSTALWGGGGTLLKDRVHVVLVDNGRSELLAGVHREALRCIGCGACESVCPVYRVGGLGAEGAEGEWESWRGPIGAVVRPSVGGLKALRRYRGLPVASTLCGACFEACPVKIDIPRHLVMLRAEMVEARVTPWRERVRQRVRAWAMGSEWTYRWWGRWAKGRE